MLDWFNLPPSSNEEGLGVVFLCEYIIMSLVVTHAVKGELEL